MVMFEVSDQLVLIPLQTEMTRFDLRQIQGSGDSLNLTLLLVGQTGLGIVG
jgi:hypothetical protein